MTDRFSSLLKNHGLRILSVALWASVLIAFFYAKSSFNLTFLDILKKLYFGLTQSGIGPLLFITTYAVRPIVLFPSSLLMVLAGTIWGFWLGFLYAMIGATVSALVAYLMARYLTDDLLMNPKHPLLLKWREEALAYPFMTVLILRLLLLPFDLVNFVSGYLKIDVKLFLLATFLSIIVDSGGFIGAGASIENIESFDPSQISINMTQLILSLVMIAISLGIAVILNRKKNVNL